MLYDQPELLHQLLAVLIRAVTDYLNAQLAAGAQALMVFDTWGGVLTPGAYRDFSLAPMAQIVAGLNRSSGGERAPVILFTKGGGPWLEDLAATGCDAVGVDWTVDLNDARRRVGARVALQGNLDPVVLHAAPERIRQQVARTLADFGPGTGHVFNLGHGVQPQVDPEHVRVLVEAVHELSAPYHAGTPS
jgi:uroporphyrinogen decarboxylase